MISTKLNYCVCIASALKGYGVDIPTCDCCVTASQFLVIELRSTSRRAYIK